MSLQKSCYPKTLILMKLFFLFTITILYTGAIYVVPVFANAYEEFAEISRLTELLIIACDFIRNQFIYLQLPVLIIVYYVFKSLNRLSNRTGLWLFFCSNILALLIFVVTLYLPIIKMVRVV